MGLLFGLDQTRLEPRDSAAFWLELWSNTPLGYLIERYAVSRSGTPNALQKSWRNQWDSWGSVLCLEPVLGRNGEDGFVFPGGVCFLWGCDLGKKRWQGAGSRQGWLMDGYEGSPPEWDPTNGRISMYYLSPWVIYASIPTLSSLHEERKRF
jgi:hypothetical protein